MDKTKKALMLVVSIAGAIYELYSFYKNHEQEIKDIINPALQACKDINDLQLVPVK